MTCHTSQQLMLAWYATATQYAGDTPGSETVQALIDERGGEYNKALAAYRLHRAECEECKQDLQRNCNCSAVDV